MRRSDPGEISPLARVRGMIVGKWVCRFGMRSGELARSSAEAESVIERDRGSDSRASLSVSPLSLLISVLFVPNR